MEKLNPQQAPSMMVRIHLDSEELDAHQVSECELDSILDVWQNATVRLEQAHSTLCEEVRRLRAELASKDSQLAERSRRAELGDVAGPIAVEMRKRLVILRDHFELLLRRHVEDSGCIDLLDQSYDSLSKLEFIVDDLIHFSANGELSLQLLSVSEVIDAVRTSLAQQIKSHSIMLVVDVPEDARVTANRVLLEQAVRNLMLNACDSMPDGGELVITAVETEQGLELEIADSGPGLSDEARYHVFDPFFQLNSSGAGLRLAVVSHILQQHGGQAAAMNCPEGGAAFTLRIPHRYAEMAHAKAG